jgi:hypothetical protein
VLVLVTSLGAGCGGDDTEGTATNLDDSATSSSAAGGSTTSSSVAGGSQAACEVQGGVGTTGTDVQVNLTEWKVEPSPARVGPGIVSFVAENTGKDPHELVVVKAESAEALPRDADGALDESKLPEGALVGEIEEMAPGGLCRGNFALTAGAYVLVCNVVEEEGGATEAHLAQGMHTPFTVGT